MACFKKSVPPERMSYKIFLLLVQILSGSLTAGVIVGWGQLQPILLDAGVYSDRCPANNSGNVTNCNQQIVDLDQMFFYGATASIFIQALGGILIDYGGPKITALFGLIMFVPGCVLFAFSDASFEWHLPSFMLISLGGPLVFVSIMPTAAIFQKNSGVVLTGMNGSYGGGALVFLIFNKLYFSYHITLKVLFLGYAAMCGLILIAVIVMWPLTKWDVPEEGVISHSSSDTDNIDAKSRAKRILKCVFTIDYMFLLVFTAFLVLKSNFYLATSSTQLQFFHASQDTVNSYETIFGLMLPIVGFCVAPVGLVIDKAGIPAGAFFLIVLSTICSIVGVIQNLPLQIVNFFVFSLYYPYIYGFWATFLIVKFGMADWGVLFAGVAAFAGGVNLLGGPLSNYSVTYARLLQLNLVLMIITVVFVVYPLGSLIYSVTVARKSEFDERARLINATT